MNNGLTEQEFWDILASSTIPQPVFYRLYYGEQGEPLFYSSDNLPGNYIEIDQQTFANSPTNIRVVDGKLVVIKIAAVPKLVPGEIGTSCHPEDVSVVVDDSTPNTKWILK